MSLELKVKYRYIISKNTVPHRTIITTTRTDSARALLSLMPTTRSFDNTNIMVFF